MLKCYTLHWNQIKHVISHTHDTKRTQLTLFQLSLIAYRTDWLSVKIVTAATLNNYTKIIYTESQTRKIHRNTQIVRSTTVQFEITCDSERLYSTNLSNTKTLYILLYNFGFVFVIFRFGKKKIVDCYPNF